MFRPEAVRLALVPMVPALVLLCVGAILDGPTVRAVKKWWSAILHSTAALMLKKWWSDLLSGRYLDNQIKHRTNLPRLRYPLMLEADEEAAPYKVEPKQ